MPTLRFPPSYRYRPTGVSLTGNGGVPIVLTVPYTGVAVTDATIARIVRESTPLREVMPEDPTVQMAGSFTQRHKRGL
jgi:hypothetical protein